jgi:trans-2,3-dihydro-3-hydroxyanthranilate isomerase
VQSPRADGADYRNRIFMTLGELRFAGHPSLGTAVAEALRRGERETRYVQETPAGLQPIEVEASGERVARASMLQEPAVFGPELDCEEVLGLVGLTAADAVDGLPVQVVGTGVPQVVAPVREGALGRVTAPDLPALHALLRAHDAVVLYLATVDGERARARSFYADVGFVSEDPATGSGAGPLMAHVHARGAAARLTVEQGVEMGRPSRLECALEGDRVRVSGDVVVVATGTVHLP